MNFKLKDRTLLNADIISPDMPYAEFDPDLARNVPKNIVNSLNNGNEMLMIYKQFRDDLHIVNVVEMLKQMEEIYRAYDRTEFEKRINKHGI